MKFKIITDVNFNRTREDVVNSFTPKNKVILSMNQFDTLYSEMVSELENKIHEHELRGSGYVFKYILYSKIILHKNFSIGGGTYVKLPFTVKYVRNIDNSLNDDNRCFMWSCLAKLYQTENHPE